MKTVSLFSCGKVLLYALVSLFLADNAPVQASFHAMKIEQAIGGIDGATSAQAIQLRMCSGGQKLLTSARLKAYDAARANLIIIKDFTTSVPNATAGSRILIASASFTNYTSVPLVVDSPMDNLIPASYLAAGRLTFESDSGTILWSLSFGGASYTGSTTGATANDTDGNFVPSFNRPLPSNDSRALLYQGTAAALSTDNAADYALTKGAATFSNNAGNNATLDGVNLSLNDVTITEGDSGTDQ